MPDTLDAAQDRIEIDLAQAMMVQKERAKASAQVQAEGFCLNPKCGEEFTGDNQRLFCGPKCAREFDRFKR
jgi:hypothetical protein